MQSEQIDQLSTSLSKAQASMKAAIFNKINPHFKNRYADLSAVIDAVRKPLADNGLSVSQVMNMTPDRLTLVTTLMHNSGQWIKSEYPLPLDATPQQLGSALTYARRYSLSCIACIAADDDDDAEEATKGSKITEAQATELIELCEAVGADRKKFLEYLKVSTMNDLPASRFNDAKSALESKRKAA